MLIENRIKRKIEYEKTDREDKDESGAQGIERERSGLSNQRVKTILSAEKSARRSETKQEGKPNCCENRTQKLTL